MPLKQGSYAPVTKLPSDFQSEVGEVFGEIGGEVPAKFGRRFSSFFCWGKIIRSVFHQNSEPQSQKSHVQYQIIFWTCRGRYPIKQGLWGKSHQKFHPKVRQNLCHRSSLGHPFLSAPSGRKIHFSSSDSPQGLFMFGMLGKRKHTPPCPREELFFAEKMGGHRGKISVVDMEFLVFIGFLYPPPAWKVFLWGQKSSPKDFLLVVVVYAFFLLRVGQWWWINNVSYSSTMGPRSVARNQPQGHALLLL